MVLAEFVGLLDLEVAVVDTCVPLDPLEMLETGTPMD